MHLYLWIRARSLFFKLNLHMKYTRTMQSPPKRSGIEPKIEYF